MSQRTNCSVGNFISRPLSQMIESENTFLPVNLSHELLKHTQKNQKTKRNSSHLPADGTQMGTSDMN